MHRGHHIKPFTALRGVSVATQARRPAAPSISGPHCPPEPPRQVWSNDRWKSPVHRVAAPTGEAAARARLSLVFFTGPPGDTLVEALPGTWGPHNPKRYPPVSARAHLLQKLHVTNS